MEITDMFNVVMNAFQGGNWVLFATTLVMMVVWALTHPKSPLNGLIKGEAKIWVAAVCGVVGAVAATVAAGGSWVAGITSGVTIGLSATGLVELLRRRIGKKPIDANKDGVLDELK